MAAERVLLRAERALLPGGFADGIEVAVEAGRIVAIRARAASNGEAPPRPGQAAGSLRPEARDCAVGRAGTEDEDRAAQVIDAEGPLLTPGLVDAHVHGAGGFDVAAGVEAIRGMARFLPQTGVTAFLPTLASSSEEETLAFLAAVAEVVGQPEPGSAEVLGAHLEGPFLNPARAGAHRADRLRPPNVAEARRWLAVGGGIARRVTLAPELDGAREVVGLLLEHGVQVSLGHSEATCEQAMEAVAWGASSITHAYNAMRPFYHRDPGLIGAALAADGLMAEIIADGVHVHPMAVMALVRARGARGVALVSDGLPALGQEPGLARWAGQAVVSDGVAARLPGGALAGSVTPMPRAVRNLVAWGVDEADALLMASESGARLCGAATRKGALAPGRDADLLVCAPDLSIRWVFCRGYGRRLEALRPRRPAGS